MYCECECVLINFHNACYTVELYKIEEQLQKLAPEELEPTGENIRRPRTREGTPTRAVCVTG